MKEVMISDCFNISIDTDVIDDIVEQLEDIIDDIDEVCCLKKIGVNFRVQYLVDNTEYEFKKIY